MDLRDVMVLTGRALAAVGDLKQLVVSGDSGRAINPKICRGQDEGAAVMGLTGALFPCMVYDGATLMNGNGLDYKVPSH